MQRQDLDVRQVSMLGWVLQTLHCGMITTQVADVDSKSDWTQSISPEVVHVQLSLACPAASPIPGPHH